MVYLKRSNIANEDAVRQFAVFKEDMRSQMQGVAHPDE